MHIVTKFLVVIAAVLSVLLAGLTIAYTSNAERIVSDLNDVRSEAQSLRGEVDALRAEQASLITAAEDERRTLEEQNADLTDRNRQLVAEKQELIARNRDLQLTQSITSAQIADGIKAVETMTNLSQNQASELTELRDRELESQKREIALVDRISDLEGRIEVADETNRALQEQLVEAREELDRLRSGGSALSDASDDVFLRAPNGFRARITDVETDSQGVLLASIDAGSNDSLRRNMKLNIVRNGFLATLIIERVDQNEAVGRIDFLGRANVDVRVGDLVLATTL